MRVAVAQRSAQVHGGGLSRNWLSRCASGWDGSPCRPARLRRGAMTTNPNGRTSRPKMNRRRNSPPNLLTTTAKSRQTTSKTMIIRGKHVAMTTGAVSAVAVAKRAAAGRALVVPEMVDDRKGDARKENGGPEVRPVAAPEADDHAAVRAGEVVEARRDSEEARVPPGAVGPVITVHPPSLNIGARHMDSAAKNGAVRIILDLAILDRGILDRGTSDRDLAVLPFEGALAGPANSRTMAITAIMAGTMNAMASAARALEGDVVMVMLLILPADTAGVHRLTLPVIRALTKWRG